MHMPMLMVIMLMILIPYQSLVLVRITYITLLNVVINVVAFSAFKYVTVTILVIMYF